MSKDTIAMIENLESKVYDHIDNIIADPSYDPSLLIDDFKAVYTEIKKDIPSEYNITNINYDIDTSLINDLIVQNTLINGNNSLNDLSPAISKQYFYQKEIIRSVRNKQPNSLKEFIVDYKIATVLIYYYHELVVLQMIMANEQDKVVPYIQEYFVKEGESDDILKLIFNKYEKEVRNLMTFLILPKKSAKYYTSVVNNTIQQLRQDFSNILGVANFACLDVLFAGGTESIEQLLKITNLEAEQFGDCLPIDLNIKTKYHSIFICPILKTFCGDDNPPMRLKCGHVISNEAVDKLSKNKSVLSFKCPYCPNDCRLSDIRRLYL